MNMTANKLFASILLLGAISCQGGRPERTADELPPIWPDYTGVTVPVNIAPMNFGPADGLPVRRMLVEVCDPSGKPVLRSRGTVARFPLRRWHRILNRHAGADLTFQVAMRTQTGWTRYRPFTMHISPDPIDFGLTYRLIPPGYQSFGHMGIYERHLSDFRQRELIDTRMLDSGCINCHTQNRTDPASFSLHVRGAHSATLLRHDGQMECLNTLTDSTGGFFVYPYWHPTGRYTAYSVNTTRQSFYSAADHFLEVYDEKSDIIVYEPQTHTVLRPRELSRKDRFETWPAFSADGNTLYYCSSLPGRLPRDARQMQYSLCSLSFDPATGTFGAKADTLVDARVKGMSLSQPRPSYDGKYLLVTAADFGTFLIWHKEADLWLYNLENGDFYPAGGINSGDTESFHNWSSNSKWAVVASRRDDGLYTRLYLAHMNEEGRFDKAFLLPQKNPGKYYSEMIYSYNTPDFTSERVPFDRHAVRKAVLAKDRQGVKANGMNP